MSGTNPRYPGGDGRVLHTRRHRLSPWVTLVERDIDGNGGPHTFHAFDQPDYVNVLAISAGGRIPLVRQYRPSVDEATLELPGGLLDEGEQPIESAARELYEETGCRCLTGLEPIGVVTPDVGRLDNRLWCFVALDVAVDDNWREETGVTVEWLSPEELRHAIADGTFRNGTGLSVLALALVGGRLPRAVQTGLLG